MRRTLGLLILPSLIVAAAALVRAPDGADARPSQVSAESRDLARDSDEHRKRGGKWINPRGRAFRYARGISERADAEIIRYQGKTYTLVRLLNTDDAHRSSSGAWVDDASSEYSFAKLMPASADWVMEQYEEQLSADREDGYLSALEEFNRRLENRMERLMLFEGEGLDKLIGTLEFTHRDHRNPYLPLEQAKGVRLPKDTFKQERYRLFKRGRTRSRLELEWTTQTTGATLEVNKLDSHPEYRGIAAPLLWTAAVMGNVFDHPVMYQFNRKERGAVGQPSDRSVWKGDDEVSPSRLEIRPNRRMVPYFEKLGFKIDANRYLPLKDSELTPAARYARENRMQVDDILMSISREEWLEIPRKLLDGGKTGAWAYFAGESERRDADWVWQQAATLGLPPEKAAEVRASLDEFQYFEGARNRWDRWAREHQAALPAEQRHWAFRREPRKGIR